MYTNRLAAHPTTNATMAAAACVDTVTVVMTTAASEKDAVNAMVAANASFCPVRFTGAPFSASTYDTAAPTTNAKMYWCHGTIRASTTPKSAAAAFMIIALLSNYVSNIPDPAE
jgi:hypothetical protein